MIKQYEKKLYIIHDVNSLSYVELFGSKRLAG